MSLTTDNELAFPNTSFPYYITVDASLLDLGQKLFQPSSNNKVQVIPFNSRILKVQDQKRFIYDRECCVFTFALNKKAFLLLAENLRQFLLTTTMFYSFPHTRKSYTAPL